MSETVLERHYRDRMQSVWRIALDEGERAALSERDFEDLVALCSDLSAAGQQLLNLEYGRIFKEVGLTVAWLLERRRVIEELSGSYIELVASFKSSAERAWQAAGSPPRQDIVCRLDDAIKSITETKQKVLERWPVGTSQEIVAAGSAGSQDYVDADEAFARIAGVDVETWRARVETHKRTRQD